MNNRYFFGADSGTLGGCISVIDTEKNTVSFFDMPIILPDKNHDSQKLFDYLSLYPDCSIVVETVRFSSRDANHATSAEKLIRSHESILTCAKLAGLIVRQMETQQWRKLAGSYFLGTDEVKICEYAIGLFPQSENRIIVPKQKGTGFLYKHNRAESLLLSYCGKLIYQESVNYAAKIRSLPPQNRERPDTHKGKPIS